MDKLPWFPFYAGEFMADAKVMGMTNEQVGIYVKLLCVNWREGFIPNDIERIGRMVGESDGNRIATAWPAISECFAVAPDDDTKLFNPKLEKVRLEQSKKIDQKAKAGRKGAKARWDAALPSIATALRPHSGTNGDPNATANGENMQEEDIDLEKEDKTKTLPIVPIGGGGTEPKSNPPKPKTTTFTAAFEKFWLGIPAYCKGSKKEAGEQWKRKGIEARGELFLDDIAEKHKAQILHYESCERLGTQQARPQDVVRWLRHERWLDEIPELPGRGQAADQQRSPGRHHDVQR